LGCSEGVKLLEFARVVVGDEQRSSLGRRLKVRVRGLAGCGGVNLKVVFDNQYNVADLVLTTHLQLTMLEHAY